MNGIGPSSLDPRQSLQDCYSDDEEDEDSSCPSIKLSLEDKARIREPWAQSLIIKVVGKSFAFSYIMARVRFLWNPSDAITGIDLGEHFILIKFKSDLDLNNVLNKGPWFLGPHFISTRRWEPGFQPSLAKVLTSAVWVRFPELPVELYDKILLQKMGAKIGTLLKIDVQTENNVKGRFARLCVQVDLSKPLTAWVKVGKHRQQVAYEGVSSICFHCGVVGHKLQDCPQTSPQPVQTDEGQFGKWMLAGRQSARSKPHPNGWSNRIKPVTSTKQGLLGNPKKQNQTLPWDRRHQRVDPPLKQKDHRVDPGASRSPTTTSNPFQILSSPLATANPSSSSTMSFTNLVPPPPPPPATLYDQLPYS